MQNTTSTYQMHTLGGLLSHFPQRLRLVRDVDEDFDAEMLSRARVRSGDYFMTLATELDKLAQNVTRYDDADAGELERLVSELIYVDRDYVVVNKPN